MTNMEIRIRRGTPDDSRATFDVSLAAMKALFDRQGNEWTLDSQDFWTMMEPFLAHLAENAAEWWVAEDRSDGSIIGYARSVERGRLIELTEFFVHPAHQSAGLGGRLLERALPPGRGDVRAIIATTDVRALARYYRAGTVPRFPIASLTAVPRPAVGGQLEVVSATVHDVAQLAAVESVVIGYPRHSDYQWLVEQREGYLYRREGRVTGFAFVSETGMGPIASLEPGDQPSILLHVEDRAHAMGIGSVSFEVPMVNEFAMRHLLGRGFQIEPPLALLMSNVPFGQFDRFISFGPPIVL